MYDLNVFVRALSRFARLMISPYDVDSALAELTRSVTGVLGLIGAGVTLANPDGQLRFITAMNDTSGDLERCQEEFQTGPCRLAYDLGEIVAVSDLRNYPIQWPHFTSRAHAVGVVAVAGIPMHLGAAKVGALDLYANEQRSWPQEELAAAQVLADMATGYIVNSSKLHQQQQLNEQLQTALGSRIVIEQAKGIIANQHGVDTNKAFELIRRHARNTQRTVRDVANAIVELRLRL